jgi:hypothetical protein
LTPDGRAVHQGILAGPEGGKGEIKLEYGASQFALIVTAEPHFAVSLPSTTPLAVELGACSAPPDTMISTRRFRARPSAVALSATSRYEPKPATSMLDAATPCPIK